MRNLLLIFFCTLSISSYSQVITVVDDRNHEPLLGVLVYNSNKSTYVITDSNGQVDLSSFSTTEKIYFKSITYKTLSITKSQIDPTGVVSMHQESDQFNPIVISASKFKQRAQEIPKKIISINSQQIIFNNPQTAADALQQSGQVFVQKSQQGGGSPMIRGFATNRLLITVDGVRMNNAIFRSGNLQNVVSIDPYSIERTEVVLGPGGVVYGSDAIGGVMNFLTLQPQFNKDSLQISGNTSLRYASANNENTAHLDFNLGSRQWASRTSLTFNFFDDLRMGSHGPDDYLREQYVIRQDDQDLIVVNNNPLKQRPTGYDQVNLLQKFRYQPNQDWDLGLGVIYSTTSNVARYDALNRFRESGLPRNAEWYYGPQQWLMTHFNAHHYGEGKWFDKILINQSYQQFKESRITRNYQSPDRFTNRERVDMFTTSIDFERRDRESNALYYGLDYVYNKVNSHGRLQDINQQTVMPSASRYPDDSSWQSAAVYANYQWRVSSQLLLNGGLRYNHVWINADFTDNNLFFNFPFDQTRVHTGALTGGIGAVWVTQNNWHIKSNISTAFRAPNIDDMGKLFDPSPNTIVVPNTNIKPEYAYSADIGVIKNWNDQLTVNATVFVTLLHDALAVQEYTLNGQQFIDYQGESSRVFAVQNSEQSNIYGLELGLNYKVCDAINVTGHYNISRGQQTQVDGDQVAVRHVPPNFGDLAINYQQGKWQLELSTQFNDQLKFDDLAPSQQSRPYLYALDASGNPYAPAWYTLNFRSSYQINDRFSCQLSVENTTDQRYRTYSSGVNAAGRNLILAASYHF